MHIQNVNNADYVKLSYDIIVFFAHKKYSHRFVKLDVTWTILTCPCYVSGPLSCSLAVDGG